MWWPDLDELIFDSGWFLPLAVAVMIGLGGACFLYIVTFAGWGF